MLRTASALGLAFLLIACGKSDKEQLHDAANQSDPAAAAVLNNAADNGMDPQEALEEAGQAAGNAPDSAPGNAAAPANQQ